MPISILPYVATFLSIVVSIGAALAFRSGYSKEARALQSQTIDALRTRLDLLEKQVASATAETLRNKTIISTIQFALSKRGIQIEVDDDFVTLIDDHLAKRTTVPIKPII